MLRLRLAVLGLQLCLSAAAAAVPRAEELRVSTTPVFFNPSLGRAAEIRVRIPESGQVVVDFLDRDRNLVRSMGPLNGEGEVVASWDGKDDQGEVVPDEAYSLRVRFRPGTGRELIYDPGQGFAGSPISVDQFTYSRIDGVLNYRLEKPSRVHIQAGQARAAANGQMEGPILRTVVDRMPRSGGAISEQWTGFDETRALYVPELPDFVMAILAVPFPENTLITTGNRRLSYIEYARRHSGKKPPLPDPHGSTGGHHQGLTGLQDRSPSVVLSGPVRSKDAVWRVGQSEGLKFEAALPPDLSELFLAQDARLIVYLESTRVAGVTCTRNPCEVSLAESLVPPGRHRLVVNWDSGRGPVGVGVVTVERRWR